VYALRYNGVNFILQGEGGGGTAQPSEVLTGKSFTNDSGDQTGTMPNRGAVIITPSAIDQAVLDGYHNGAGKVNAVTFDTFKVLTGTTIAGTAGTMPNNGAYNITPGPGNVTIPVGYHSGAGVVYGDADLVAGNIKSGVNIFGVTGTYNQIVTSASDTIQASYDSVISTYSLTPQKRVEFRIMYPGTVRVSFDIVGGYFMIDVSAFFTYPYARVYKNGVAVGTTRTHTGGGYITFTEDFTVVPNDLVQIYFWTDNAGDDSTMKCCRLKYTLPISTPTVVTY
jgi:hypothetical protein